MAGKPKASFYVALAVVVLGLVAFAYYRSDIVAPPEVQPDKGGRRFVTACATELKSGSVELLSETKAQNRRASGEHDQTRILVLAQATIVK
jgi:hypothetical protein